MSASGPAIFVIPAVHLTWWDLDSKRLRTIDFPVRELEVAPNPAIPSSMPPAEQPGRSASRSWWPPMLVAFAAVCLGWLFFWQNGQRIGRWFAPFRPTRLAPLNPPGGNDR